MGRSAGAVVAAAGRESAPSTLFSFTQARDFLSSHGIDLEAKRKERVRDALRWDEVTPKNADKFGASFDAAKVSEADLQALVQRLEKEPHVEQRVILGVNDATPEQGLHARIDRIGIPNYIQQDGRDYLRDFSTYLRVDARTREPLEDQRPTGEVGITFLPHMLNLPPKLCGISANDQLAKMASGGKYLGPNGYMIYIRQCIDTWLRARRPDMDKLSPADYKEFIRESLLYHESIDRCLPDTKTGTQFPDLRHRDDGKVARLGFDLNIPRRYFPAGGRHHVVLYGVCPDRPYDNLGGREVLGTFLS